MKIPHLLSWAVLAASTALASPSLAGALEPGATVAAAAPSAPVDFDIVFPLRNGADLESLVVAQHTQGSPQYQQWLTPAQFAAKYGPTAQSMAKVRAAIAAAGLTVDAVYARSIHVTGTADQVNKLFQARLNAITSPNGHRRMVAASSLLMPTALQQEGATVLGFENLPLHKPNSIRSPAGTLAKGAAPANRFSPEGPYFYTDLKQAYDYPSYQSKLPDGKRLDGTGVNAAVLMGDLLFPGDVQAEFDEEGFSASTGKSDPNVNTVLIDGGGQVNGPDAFEASLDVQQIQGGAPGANVTLVSIPDLSDQHIMDGYNYIVQSNQYDVVNSSFGECELEYTKAFNGGTDFTYILKEEHEIFLQGNAQGITFVASSGDEGGPACPSANYAPGVNATFIPGISTPSDDPNVTAVGGGNLLTTSGNTLSSAYGSEIAFGDPEVPYDIYNIGALVSGGYWGAGGGVSQIWPAPLYQVATNNTNNRYRTNPDVGMEVGGLSFSIPGYCQAPASSCSPYDTSVLTAYGVNFGGGFYYTIGTSVASPEFVGALALYIEKTGHRQGNINYYLYLAGLAQTVAGGVNAPAALQFFHRGQTGFDGVYSATTPSKNYNYIYGNGSPDVRKLFGMTNYPAAGVPQTPSNP